MPDAALSWRLLAVGVALVLVVIGLVGLASLAAAEWRREPPTRPRYLRVIAMFAVAFVLVLVATA